MRQLASEIRNTEIKLSEVEVKLEDSFDAQIDIVDKIDARNAIYHKLVDQVKVKAWYNMLPQLLEEL